MASRYLATVRRAMSIPAPRSRSTMVSSDSTSCAFSASIRRLMRSRTASAEWDSPPSDAAIADVYRGPLEQFVARRDALVKQLRASKQREHADRVKSLRKPSRVAWVLDNVVHEDAAAIQQLEAAIDHAQTGEDVRSAFTSVKAAVSNIAAIGARIAVRAEQPVAPAVISAAVHAVIGHADAFAEWRDGRLVEVPAAGGLDMLAAITLREASSVPQPPSPPTRVEAGKRNAAKEDERAEAAAKRDRERLDAARADLRRAESVLADANDVSARAVQSVAAALTSLDEAERALAAAKEEVESRRAFLEGQRRVAASLAAERERASRAVAAARSRHDDLEGTGGDDE